MALKFRYIIIYYVVYFYFQGEKCTTYYTMGYKYSQWYNATPINTLNVANNKSDVLLKFYVRGSSNAHVMLTADPPSFGYEIVLGGGANTFCDIRKSNRYNILITLTPIVMKV